VKLLRGMPRAAQNASMGSPDVRCCEINVRQPSMPRRIRLRGGPSSLAFIVCPP
jgi:hypothetical protein